MQDLPPGPGHQQQQRFISDDQSAGAPTMWDADSRLADRCCGTQRPPEAVSFRRPTDAIDACDERTTTYSVPATARACRQASNDAMPPPQRTPALHAIDGTAAALRCCTPPPVACWLRTLHASPRRSKRDSRARRPCPPHVRARCPCQLPAGCVSRCAHDAARRCPKAKTAGDARPHCTHHHHRHHVVCSAGVV